MTPEFGYAGKILRVDLSSGSVNDIPTANYAGAFLGGRGIAAKLYWDEVPTQAKPFDAENRLIFVTGPLNGIPGTLAGAKVAVVGKSPIASDGFCWCSIGGSWGSFLKSAGYDGIIVQGKSEKPVYLFVHDGGCVILDAHHLWNDSYYKVQEKLKSEHGPATRVLANGPAGDNMVVFATLQTDNDSAGAGGLAAVMGSKRLKAIAVTGQSRIAVADPPKLLELTHYIHRLKVGPEKGPRKPVPNPNMKWRVCYGCIGCTRSMSYTAEDGQQGKFMCRLPNLYSELARKYYGQNTDVPFLASRLCRDLGIDSASVEPILKWLPRWVEAGIVTEESTGLPMSQVGSLDFIKALLMKIAYREGFGDILAEGFPRTADLVGSGARELVADVWFIAGDERNPTRHMYPTYSLIQMMGPRERTELRELVACMSLWSAWLDGQPGAFLSTDVLRGIARKFWGGDLAVDFSTHQGKALAAIRMANRQCAKECLILCDCNSPILYVESSGDHVGDPTIPAKLLSAVTGKEWDEAGLDRLGERVFNLLRAISVREGRRGREDDTFPKSCFAEPFQAGADHLNGKCLLPGKGEEVLDVSGKVADRESFEVLKDEFYELRGWDVATGLQTEDKLKELGLGEVSEDLKRRGLLQVSSVRHQG